MSTKIWVLIMSLLTAAYMILLGSRGVVLIADPNWIAKAMGLLILVFPILGIWSLYMELRFGLAAQALVLRARKAGVPELMVELRPSGKAVKQSALIAFEGAKSTAEADPENWESWVRLSEGYDASGDRKRARSAMRHAILLAKQTKSS
jgi:cytochrome c-type biogenesis protein CcmH/NrfG